MTIQNLSEIKPRRKELKITQTELAKRAGVSQALIARIESGNVDPSYSKIKAIFEALESFTEKEEIKAKDIMAKGVFGVQGTETVEEATKIMKKYKISQMPVFEENKNKIIGGLSEKTIVDRLVIGDDLHKLSERKVQEVMDDAFPLVGRGTAISLISVLLEHSPAVIVADKGEYIGIITKADLLRLIK